MKLGVKITCIVLREYILDEASEVEFGSPGDKVDRRRANSPPPDPTGGRVRGEFVFLQLVCVCMQVAYY